MNHSIRPIEKIEVNKKKTAEKNYKISKMWKRVNDVRTVGIEGMFNEDQCHICAVDSDGDIEREETIVI